MGHTSASVQAWLGYLRVEELAALKRLAAELPDGAVVANLGAGGGTSGLAFMESPNHLQVTTVDRQKKSNPYGCLTGEEAVLRSAGFWGDPRHRQIHGDSTEVGIMWDGPPIDLLFHDADHTYAKVTRDLEVWRPHVKPGGLIVLHDYDHRQMGVKRVADEMLKDCERVLLVERMAAFRLPGGRLRVNLFDFNFKDSACSVFGKEARKLEYVRGQSEWDGVTIFTDEFINDPVVDQVQSRWKIGWLHEPHCLHPETYQRAFANRGKFDLILTYYQPFLEHPGFEFSPSCGVWVPREHWGLHPKTKMLSMLYGAKMATEGHRFRHEAADALEAAGIQMDFFDFKGIPTTYGWETKVKVLRDYRFTVVIEACHEENDIGEPALDAFAMGTVPIYRGCPNFSWHFDERGILRFETIEELVDLAASLTEELYDDLLDARRENLRLVSDWEIADDWIYEHILKGRFE